MARPKCLQPTRNRMVNFRLSETEFRELKEEIARVGARSMGDYIRECVSASAPGGIGYRLSRIERLLSEKLEVSHDNG